MAKGLQITIIAVVLFLSCLEADASRVCKRKTVFGKIRFTCPEPGQSPDLLYCCGDDDDFGGQFCCRGNNIFDGRTVNMVARDIGSIIGTIVGILGFLLILFIICCCCPCCILYKRRNGGGGRVYRTPVPASTAANVTVIPAPDPRSGSMPTQPPPIGFNMPQYPNPAGYPPTYPPQPYNPAAGPFYPTQPVPPHQNYDQPPPYAGFQEGYPKQSAYNPGY